MISREDASNRKNGIAFYDTSDPAHPKLISDYTATVTGGVHSAFVDGHYVYLTDDATGSMRVIDFADVKNPKEVARWQTESPLASMISTKGRRANRRTLHSRSTSQRWSRLSRLLARWSGDSRRRRGNERRQSRRSRSSSANFVSITTSFTATVGWRARTPSFAIITTCLSATKSSRRSSISSHRSAFRCAVSFTWSMFQISTIRGK